MIIINQVSVYEGLRDLLFLTKLPPTHREEPFVFQIGRKQMIEGWEKGLLNMCVGEKRKLVVPSDMVSLFVCSLDLQCMNLSKLQMALVSL